MCLPVALVCVPCHCCHVSIKREHLLHNESSDSTIIALPFRNILTVQHHFNPAIVIIIPSFQPCNWYHYPAILKSFLLNFPTFWTFCHCTLSFLFSRVIASDSHSGFVCIFSQFWVQRCFLAITDFYSYFIFGFNGCHVTISLSRIYFLS